MNGTAIAATTPRVTTEAFVAALNDRDLETAVGCCSREACLITPDSTAVSGRGEIRGILAQMIAQRPGIAIGGSSAIVAGEVAHLKQRWRIRIDADSARPHTWEVDARFVAQRIEASWKLAIVAPWGLP